MTTNLYTRKYRNTALESMRQMTARFIGDHGPGYWRHHGLGLLQMYVSKDVRIHVWHPSLVRGVIVDNGARHNHRFSLISHVLSGDIINNELLVTPQIGGEWSEFSVVNASQNKTDEPTKIRASLGIAKTNKVVIEKGWSYRFPKWKYHWTQPLYDDNSVVVTVVERYEKESKLANILSKRTPAHAFSEGHLVSPDMTSEVLCCAIKSLGGKEYGH